MSLPTPGLTRARLTVGAVSVVKQAEAVEVDADRQAVIHVVKLCENIATGMPIILLEHKVKAKRGDRWTESVVETYRIGSADAARAIAQALLDMVSDFEQKEVEACEKAIQVLKSRVEKIKGGNLVVARGGEHKSQAGQA